MFRCECHLIGRPSVTNSCRRLLESQSLVPIVGEMLALHQLCLSRDLVTKGAEYWNAWKTLTIAQDHFRDTVTIALVGKYLYQPDA